MQNHKTIVLGCGFLGSEFERHGYDVLGRGAFLWPGSLDVLEPFDTIINCIGNADTRACEHAENWREVSLVNTELVAALSNHAHRKGKRLVHISTGCVYDRNNAPQCEDGKVSSHCRYVVSKLAAEYACHADDLILRPRLYFSAAPDKNNLLCKLPAFSKHLTEINSYTSTRTIVEATTALLSAGQSGIFNVAQTGYASIAQISSKLGLPARPRLDGVELQREQGLGLVNNIMDVSKLEAFYQPRELLEEMAECWQQLGGSKLRAG